MEQRNIKPSHILLIATAVVVSFLCFEVTDKLVFAVYVKINNGIYPQFMPPFVETTSYYIGGFIVSFLSLAILSRNKYKTQITSTILILIFLALFKLNYSVEPLISYHMLRYEVILGGALYMVIYFLFKRYLASNKTFSRTRDRAG